MKVLWVFIVTTAYCCFWSSSAITPWNSRLSGFSDQYQSQNTLGEYTFGYNEDHATGGSFRRETSDRHGEKIGSYGLRVADGRLRIVNYIADHNGFRAQVVSNEPGLESQNSNGYSKITRKIIQSIIIPGYQYSSKGSHLTPEINRESNQHQMESEGSFMSEGNLSHEFNRYPLEAEQSSRSSTSVIRDSSHYPEESEKSSASYVNINQESNNSVLEAGGRNFMPYKNIRIESDYNPVENEQSSRSGVTFQENTKILKVKQGEKFGNTHLVSENKSQRSMNSGRLLLSPQLHELNEENLYSSEADGRKFEDKEGFKSNQQEKEIRDGSISQDLFSKSEKNIRNHTEILGFYQAEKMGKRFGERIYRPIIDSPSMALKNV